MADKKKYDLEYLYMRYKKFYKKGEMKKAKEYNSLAVQYHQVNLADRFHKYLDNKEKKDGPFGLGKTRRLRYG